MKSKCMPKIIERHELIIIFFLIFFILVGWYIIYRYIEAVIKEDCNTFMNQQSPFGIHQSFCPDALKEE